ncbi:PREDICTED: DNA repair protein complementing XP-C cells homolog [Dufourea novaeangliae]|uniref:DNA repair protein complementing XP-C cells like protein n=1 Tax=Dufourea novaeangliae TaxID=178035 RepID=A0A154NY02_DUFNO|nr:PREDICTED: DNA repair protein complementing XP-C cells homolog [Dufourea novaeangliae]KZC04461.1 DNA repair protein complementing XP-C cells like protein [Dufourea novaeangliae]
MSGLSEGNSSDSSDEFLVDPEKINLNSSFFVEKHRKVNVPALRSDTENESSEEEDLENVSQTSNIELFTQVLKNLERSQKLEANDDCIKQEESSPEHTAPQKKEEKVQVPKKEVDNVSSNEINELLLQGETSGNSSNKKSLKQVTIKEEDDTEDTPEYTIPKDGVKIILPGTSFTSNRKKKSSQDLMTILKRKLRANQVYIEKVGLLCWLAYGFHLNRQANQPEVMSTVLSLMSSDKYPKNRIDLTYLEKFTKWFKRIFEIEAVESNGNACINNENLLKLLREKKITDYRELVVLYVAMMRALGLHCRLVVSLGPPHKALSDNPIFKLDSKGQQDKSKSKSAKEKTSAKSKKKEPPEKEIIIQNSPEAKKNASIEAKKRAAEILRLKSQTKVKKIKSDATQDSKTTINAAKDSSVKHTGKKSESSTVEGNKNVSSVRQLRSRKLNISSEDDQSKKSTDSSSKNNSTKSKYFIEEESTDSEAEFQPKLKRVMNKKWINEKEEKAQSSKTSKKTSNKLLSSDSENEETNKGRKSQDLWAEVYLESEESWICVSVMEEKVHCVTEIYKKAKKPVLYVVAWNSENLIKDVTRRYCSHWLTVTRKERIDEKWWTETLSYWKEKNTAISRAEDQMLLDKELEQPLPKTIGECKGHPLYVIARHLLKFEALYPPDCVPLGHTSSGEAIYSRHCVHSLCSRETWLKKAKVVKPNQEPYKIVKARPKYDKLSGAIIKNSALEVFGEWQTTDYEPPEAKDGIVPRNEYGNVDLFKQCMLPKGTVHINLPALNRIARKLNIDCAPAVVGFNFGCMGAVPAIEGYVVCSEYEDILREAWETEQVEAAKRAREKLEKRVYGNWRKLIRGLLIRERLAAKYDFSQEVESTATSKRTKYKKTDAKKAKVS